MPSSPSTWNPGRFLKTLAYFEALPFFKCFQRWFGGATEPPSVTIPQPHPDDSPTSKVLFDFVSLPADTLQTTWGALDDVVMGGVSSSTFQSTRDGALFTGTVSTANSGGFASVRTRNFQAPLDLSAYQGIQLRVKGDGNRYKFLLRSDPGWDSTAYSYSFDAIADQWIDVYIPFAALTPVFRARTVPNAAPFNAQQVYSLQLMLSKFEYDGGLNPHFSAGAFAIAIASIRAY